MDRPPALVADPRPTVTAAPDLETARLELRQDPTTTEAPEPVDPALCGWIGGTSAYKCDAGQTCKFNTDWYAVGCCSDDNCNWQTACCGFNPNNGTATFDGTTSICGKPGEDYGNCDATAPFCATFRWENGYTIYYCTDDTSVLTSTVLLTSAGETTSQAGIVKLTGSNGPASATTDASGTVTVTVTPTAIPLDGGDGSSSSKGGGASTGAIAGSAVGGAAFGAIVTLLAVLLTWYCRRKKEQRAASTPAGGQNAMSHMMTPDQPTAVYPVYNNNASGGGGADHPRYSVVPQPQPGDGMSPYSVVPVGAQYSVAGSTFVGTPSPPAFKDADYLQQHNQHHHQQVVVTPVVEAPDGRGPTVFEMSAQR